MPNDLANHGLGADPAELWKSLFQNRESSPWEKLLRSVRAPAPTEINCGAFFRQPDGSYDIEANTAQGLYKFTQARKTSGRDAQSEIGTTWVNWRDDPVASDPDVLASSAIRERTPALLDQLPQSCGEDRRRLIFKAEQERFEGDKRPKLIAFLRQYIEENRDSNDREELVAVASAIRKCVAMMSVADIGWAATLLEAGHRAAPTVEVELEVAKMVFRKFSAIPSTEPEPQPELAARLAEIAIAYLNPRILPRDRHAAVAMLAVQALMVMLSRQCDRVIEQVNASPFAWFRQQLRRRMERVVAEWTTAGASADALRGLTDRINANQG